MVPPWSNRRFVGREKELRRLEDGLEAAAGGMPKVFVMGGEAGVGKSRLVEEFLARAAGAGAAALDRWLRRCRGGTGCRSARSSRRCATTPAAWTTRSVERC